MGRIRTWSAAAAVVIAGALVVTLSPSEGTDARWRDSATRSVSGPSSDTFGMTATNVADNAATPWPNGRMATSPQITLANQSTRHSSWVNVQSARVARVAPDSGSSVPQDMSLQYTSGSGACVGGGQGSYWQARGAGQVTPGTTYPREQTKVAGATIAPGQTRVLCPVVNFTTGATQTLLNYAGRAFDITTVVNQRSEAPATWASQPRTVTSRYRLAMPPPVKPSPATAEVCRTTLSNGDPSPLGYFGGFFWGWPDASTSSQTSTPAMAGGWDIMRKSRNGTWEAWKSVSAGNARELAGINSRDISDQRHEIRDFKLRGYPFAGDKTRYVESAWIARADNNWSLLTDRWRCHESLPNPDAGPHNMP